MSRLRTILKLIALPSPMRNLRRSANIEGIMSGWALLNDVWSAAKRGTQENGDQQADATGPNVVLLRTGAPDPAQRRAIASSWRNCWLFLGVGIAYIAALLTPALVQGHRPSAALVMDSLLVGLLFAAGYLRQALGNWRLRCGARGSFWQFLKAGSAAWPRRYR
ncbi:hypothetical protein [Asaia sp. As-1742]|uniref:hypothetical protein n=1 Tax=Asaia sp. As-1742 TaxID=2608325 RepID=UPI00142317F8|nr:hypothetical protein [Asaia sp. As-1742]NIE81438.1 hypothetical protein [Asaia sp. As-1742]